MNERIIVLLRINNKLYKFFSVFFTKSDKSFYIRDHLKDELAPLAVAEPFHMLKTKGNFDISTLERSKIEDFSTFHLSVHPKRVYLKKIGKDKKEEHLIPECEPQNFNDKNFRLHCALTPAPIDHLEEYKKKENVKEVIFDWKSNYCPLVSVYELNDKFDSKNAKQVLPAAKEVIVVESDGFHPSLAFHLSEENSPWLSNCRIFAKIIKKKPITKQELKRIIEYNGLNIDISSLPDNAIITDFKMENADKL